MAETDENDEEQVKERDLALQGIVGLNPYVLIEVETNAEAEESTARVSTNLNKEQVADVLFGILAQLNE